MTKSHRYKDKTIQVKMDIAELKKQIVEQNKSIKN